MADLTPYVITRRLDTAAFAYIPHVMRARDAPLGAPGQKNRRTTYSMRLSTTDTRSMDTIGT